MACTCFIVSKEVLDKLARDKTLSPALRKASRDTSLVSQQLRNLREQARTLTMATHTVGADLTQLAAAPKVTVYDCKQTQTLPGSPVSSPKNSKDATAKRAFTQTTRVAEFYKKVFKRNSIDNAGMTMMSSVHYGVKFNNAMWNGSQMVYGDGDTKIFVDFTNGNDVIGHELTHGVTQHSLQLAYQGDAGGLNESVSDCFGSMFRQWDANQDVKRADWLIGRDIMGPEAKAKGFTSLRNMANPADKHCLAPQPTKYSQITPGMDPHFSSGPPNLAFCTACIAAGGQSWDTIGQVWYAVLTGSGSNPSMTMKDFANRTRQVAGQLFSRNAAVIGAVDHGWKTIGI
jgi:Zn-dependent metalloprotease